MNRIALALPLLALGTTGCLEAAVALTVADALDGPNRSYDDTYVDDQSTYDDGYDAYDVIEGEMVGDMPGNGRFDRPVTVGTVWVDGGWIDFDIHASSSDWAMVVGSIDTSRLEEGVPTELSPGEFSITGCGGPVRNQADYYDLPAESVVVTEEIVEIDGVARLELTIAGSFGDGDEVTTVVVVPVPDEE